MPDRIQFICIRKEHVIDTLNGTIMMKYHAKNSSNTRASCRNQLNADGNKVLRVLSTSWV